MNPQNPSQPTMNTFPQKRIKKVWPYVVGALLVVLVGVGTAWMISGKVNGGSAGAAPGAKVTSTSAGVLDPSVKYDTATGVLQDGGLNGEGNFHLVRDGGASHYVYLISSVVDLSSFVNKTVQVWGQTEASKKVGWLMDVAKVQVAQ